MNQPLSEQTALAIAPVSEQAKIARGWYAAATSGALVKGRAITTRILGNELVLFRDGAGNAKAVSAYCPHLGAHLGHGGRVEEGCIRCPFHGWKFNGSGDCTDIPMATKIPPNAKLKTWPVQEVNGLVMVSFGENDTVPVLFDGRPAEWSLAASQCVTLDAPACDVLENAVDSAHFSQVHAYRGRPSTVLTIAGRTLRAETTGTALLLRLIPVATRLTIVFHGPGLVEGLIHAAVAIRFVSSVVPIDGGHCRQFLQFYVRRSFNPLPGLIAKWIVVPTARAELRQDMPIWRHKIHLQRPVLCDADGPIMKYRKWYAQFLG